MKAEILAKVEELGKILPANTLDQLIDELGGPENVSEMTGRKGRVVQVLILMYILMLTLLFTVKSKRKKVSRKKFPLIPIVLIGYKAGS